MRMHNFCHHTVNQFIATVTKFATTISAFQNAPFHCEYGIVSRTIQVTK